MTIDQLTKSAGRASALSKALASRANNNALQGAIGSPVMKALSPEVMFQNGPGVVGNPSMRESIKRALLRR